MATVPSRVLAVTDLTASSYKLVGFAALVAGSPGGEVVLVSMYSQEPAHLTVKARLRHEGQLLERQRQWCAEHGVQCRAELCEDRVWSEFVAQSARRVAADLILVGLDSLTGTPGLVSSGMERLAQDAPCPVSVIQLPGGWASSMSSPRRP